MPLRFPYDKPIGNATKSFIKKCLVIDESRRIGWEEVFTHEMLKNTGKIEHPTLLLDEKSKNIFRKMQEIVQTHNLNIVDIFKNFDKE